MSAELAALLICIGLIAFQCWEVRRAERKAER